MTASRSRLPTRARLVKEAKHLFQQRGYHAVGTAEIVAQAQATKGSLYHHFPEGKERIASDVVVGIRDDVLAQLDTLSASGMNAVALVEALSEGMARWLQVTKYREGSLLASLAVGAVPDAPLLHQALAQALEAWTTRLAALLTTSGFGKKRARVVAQSVLAGLEGAIVMARISGDAQMVIEIGRTLAALVERGEQTR